MQLHKNRKQTFVIIDYCFCSLSQFTIAKSFIRRDAEYIERINLQGIKTQYSTVGTIMKAKRQRPSTLS